MHSVISRPLWCISVHCKYPLPVMTAFLSGFKSGGTQVASARFRTEFSDPWIPLDSTHRSPTSAMADGIKAVFEKRKAEVSRLRAALQTVSEHRVV